MDSVVHPVEQHIYSWMIANTSRQPNDTLDLTLLTSEDLQQMWLQRLDLPLQHVSLGFIALLALENGVRSSGKLLRSMKLLPKKCNFNIYNVVCGILKTTLALGLLLLLVPVVLPFVCIFWLASCFVSLVYRVNFGSSVTKASGMDSVWGTEYPNSRPFITVTLLLSGAPDLAKITQHIQTKILDVKDSNGDHKHKKFRQMFAQICGYYAWRNVNDFNVENHIRVVNLRSLYSGDSRGTYTLGDIPDIRENEFSPTVARSSVDDELIHRYISEEGTSPLSPDRPPWEIILLLRGDRRYTVLVRLHHAIGDGVSLMRLWMEVMVEPLLSLPPVGSHSTSPLVRGTMMLWSAMVLPLGLLQLVANFDNNVLHGPPLSGTKIMTASAGLPLAVLKQVKVAACATVNDVLMSCLAAALTKHFTRRLQEVPQVTVAVPVSFHDFKEAPALINRFSVATIKLPTLHTFTPTARLAATKRVLDEMKRDPALGSVMWLVRMVSGVLPASLAQRIISGAGVTAAASNVPGPQQEISIWGHKVEDMLFWVPNRAPVGVSVSFASYMGEVKVGLNVDVALIHSRQEAQMLLRDMEDELQLLYRQLVVARK
ncbi:uncharacterized protein [Cherax quadricarinatus]